MKTIKTLWSIQFAMYLSAFVYATGNYINLPEKQTDAPVFIYDGHIDWIKDHK